MNVRLFALVLTIGVMTGAAVALASDDPSEPVATPQQQALIDRDNVAIEQAYIEQLQDEIETGGCAQILNSGAENAACQQVVEDASDYAAGNFDPEKYAHPVTDETGANNE